MRSPGSRRQVSSERVPGSKRNGLSWYQPWDATSASSEEGRRALYRSRCGLGIRHRPPYRAFQVPEYAGRLTVVTPQFIRAVHGRNLPIQVWTVNDESEMRRMLALGVDILTTDRPDLARRLVAR